MLAVFRQIQETGEELIVTDFDRPVLKVTAYSPPISIEEAFSGLEGKIVFNEDPTAATTGEWMES